MDLLRPNLPNDSDRQAAFTLLNLAEHVILDLNRIAEGVSILAANRLDQ